MHITKREKVIEVKQLTKLFKIRAGVLSYFIKKRRHHVRAADGVSFVVLRGEILGLVGESGCGKTTTGRVLVGLLEPTEGEVLFKGRNIHEVKNKDEKRKLRCKIQMVFQDPYASLSPWLTVSELLAEPLRINKLTNNREEEFEKIQDALRLVRLEGASTLLSKYPSELSGGQRQRVSVARALLLQPEFLVADEPVSMVDASLRLSLLNVFRDLKEKYKLSCLYITHDIASAWYLCDRIAVMYIGKVMEIGSTDDVIYSSRHPYTQALMAAVPIPDPKIRRPEVPIKGRVQTIVDLPLGCRFHPRCPYAKDICETEEPELRKVGKNHLVACHFVEKLQF